MDFKKFPEMEIDRQDESFTSSESKEIIIKSGIKKKKDGQISHRQDQRCIDFAEILKTYLICS